MAAIAHYIANPSFTSFSKSNLHHILWPSYKPMRITMSKNQSYSTSINHDVEAHIEQVLSGRQPASVVKPMQHIVFAAPRNLGPALCVAACEIVGGHREQAIVAASALHLMHSAAFTHENLPTSNQPQSGVHHAFDANIELLTGDGVFPLGYEMLAELDDASSNISKRILRVIIEISNAMGAQGLVDGQYIQQRCVGPNRGEKGDVEWVQHVCEKKEGGLYACSAACGAILGGGSDEEIEKVRRYGFYVGMMHGMMIHGVGLEEKKLLQTVKVFRCLAIKELESFQDRDVEAIQSLMVVCFPKNQESPKAECYV